MQELRPHRAGPALRSGDVTPAPTGPAGPDGLAHVLASRAVFPVFQPVVDLRDGALRGLEALARGPRGTTLETPAGLFAAAHDAGRIVELDRLCRARALETARRAELRAPTALFVNVEPIALALDGDLASEPGADLAAALPHLADLQERGIAVVLEFTERALSAHPARMLAVADRARAAGVAIALDDVGADPASLALMPFLRPEVVKLDLRLVQSRPDDAIAEVMTAVTAYAEQTGAEVVAEGVETAQHEQMARSLGATLAQGWRYGRPAPIESVEAVIRATEGAGPRTVLRPWPDRGRAAPRSPFAAVSEVRTPQTGSRALLGAVSRLIERQATELRGLAVVLATFQVAPNFSGGDVRRYENLVDTSAFVAAIGAGMGAEPLPGLRGADLDPDDPLGEEWDVAVVGPHFAVALVARDREPRGAGEPLDPDRAFDYVLTYDRTLVLDVARSLMDRVLPV